MDFIHIFGTSARTHLTSIYININAHRDMIHLLQLLLFGSWYELLSGPTNQDKEITYVLCVVYSYTETTQSMRLNICHILYVCVSCDSHLDGLSQVNSALFWIICCITFNLRWKCIICRGSVSQNRLKNVLFLLPLKKPIADGVPTIFR